MSDKPYNPLVSVTVITYNSSKYVLETLESIKAQTYQNIELIVSDDCSSDNTVALCREWIEKNKDRFVEAHLITSWKNTGITANQNRALDKCKGDWVKGIAGDDLLFNCSIEILVKSIKEKTKILASELVEFKIYNEITLSEKMIGKEINRIFKELQTAESQFLFFLKGFYIPGSVLFIERKTLIELNGYCKAYSFVEDRPLLLKYTYNGIKIFYIPDVLVGHRRHTGCITAKRADQIIPRYLWQVYEAIYHYAKLCNKFIYMINAKWHLTIFRLINLLGNKGRTANALNMLRTMLQPIRLQNMAYKMKLLK